MLYKPTFAQLNNHSYWNHPRYYGCVGHWWLGEGGGLTAYDISGYNNHGTLTNGPTWTGGQFGHALNFDATNDYINAGSATILDNPQPITISAWVKLTAAAAADAAIVAKNSGAASAGRWSFFAGPSFGPNSLGFFKDGATDLIVITVANAVTVGVWNHVVMTWDGSVTATNLKFYVDGKETAIAHALDQNGATLVSDAAISLSLGGQSDGAAVLPGLLDDVRIYKRVLNAQERAWLYHDPFAEFRSPVRKRFTFRSFRSLAMMGVGR